MELYIILVPMKNVNRLPPKKTRSYVEVKVTGTHLWYVTNLPTWHAGGMQVAYARMWQVQ